MNNKTCGIIFIMIIIYPVSILFIMIEFFFLLQTLPPGVGHSRVEVLKNPAL